MEGTSSPITGHHLAPSPINSAGLPQALSVTICAKISCVSNTSSIAVKVAGGEGMCILLRTGNESNYLATKFN